MGGRSRGPQRDTLIAGGQPGAGHDLVGRARLLAISGLPSVHEEPAVKTCDFCGRTEDDDSKTLTWSAAVENGRRRTFCEVCSREHLRAMESKLDSEWW
jgi:hypothetical protein